MNHVEAYVWHDKSGEIVAVGHVPDSVQVTVEPVAAEGHEVVRTSIARHMLDQLHLTHRVDPRKGNLVEKGGE